MAPAIKVHARSKTPLFLLLSLVGMAAGPKSGSIGELFQMIIRWSIIGGGLIVTAATAITAVMTNFTLIETGIPALDLLITGGLAILLGFTMIVGLLKVISPESGKFLKL